MREVINGGALTEVTFFILLALYKQKHGYAIKQFVEKETQNRLTLGAGTLYGAINSAQDKGWITPCNTQEERKKEYIITQEGKVVAEKEIRRLRGLLATAIEITKGEEK